MSQQLENGNGDRSENESADFTGKLARAMMAVDFMLVSLAIMVTVDFFTT